MFASEYGFTKDDVYKLTTREVSEMVDAMISRKTGKNTVKTKLDEEQEEKIKNMAPKNFKDRKRGK